MNKEKINAIIGLLIIVSLFIAVSFLTQKYLIFIESFIGESFLGMLVYVNIIIFSVVLAPVSELAIIPLASNLWGFIPTAILSIIGWTIGSILAFALARRFGRPLVMKFSSIERISKLEKMVPEKNVFWGIVLLRMAIPVDLLSYVLGLLSRIKLRDFILATIIGVSPFAFILAYLGELTFKIQIFALGGSIIIIFIGWLIWSNRKIKKSL